MRAVSALWGHRLVPHWYVAHPRPLFANPELPAETVYGLGANALDEVAVRKIFEYKGRPLTGEKKRCITYHPTEWTLTGCPPRVQTR